MFGDPYTNYGHDPNASAFVSTIKEHAGKGVDLSGDPVNGRALRADLHDLATQGPGFFKYLPETFGKEFLNHGGGLIPLTRGATNLANSIKNLPYLYLALNNGLLRGAAGAGSKDGFKAGFIQGVEDMYKVLDKYNLYIPDAPLIPYREEVKPEWYDNNRFLTEKELRLKDAGKFISEDSAQDLATMGLGKAVKPLKFLGQVGKADLAINPVQMAVSGTMGIAEGVEKRKQQKLQEKMEEAERVFSDTPTPMSNPWYHHAAVGYGAGGLTGGATGYILSTLMGGDKATRVISTVGGGALGAVLGRIIQQKMLKS